MLFQIFTAGAAEQTVYAMVQEVAKRFEAENGSIICRVLLGLDKNERPAPHSRSQNGGILQKAPLPELCKMAADILDDFIKNQK